jgi:hypothetical protein
MASAILSFVLAGVLSVFVFIGRTGFRASSYAEGETEVRRGLEVFAEDARLASDIHWNSAQSLTLTVPTAGAPAQYTYAYDNTPGSDSYQCLYRVAGDAGSTQPRRILVHHVTPDFSFQRFKLVQPGVTDNAAANDLETKQVRLVLRTARTSLVTAGATQAAASASYILRNKRVSN